MKKLYVKVEYADKNITTQIEPYLLSLEYTDNLDGKTGDTLKVSLEDSQRLFDGPLYPVKGSALCFEFGYGPDNAFKSGKGYRIDGISIFGGEAGDIVEWTASAQLPSSDIHTKRCRAWTDTTLESVARAIADEHELDLVYECDDDIKLLRVDQLNQTNLSLLKRLAESYGLVCSIKGGKNKPTIVIMDLYLALSMPPRLKIYRSDCISYSFTDYAGLNTKGRYTRYFDPDKKELIEFEYDRLKGKDKDGLSKLTVETLDGRGQQNRVIAREAMEVFASRADKSPESMTREAKLELPGNPGLISGVALELPEAEWRKNSGAWVISKSAHTLDVGNGYKTAVNLIQ